MRGSTATATSHTDTLSQSVTIPSGCSNYTLSFWLHIDTAETTTTIAYDKLTVTLGSTTLATYSNLNKASGYEQRSFNVSGFAGQTVTLTFTGTEDSSLQTSFVIDDTALNVELRQRKGGAPRRRRPATNPLGDGYDVASLGALLALGRLELDTRALGERLEALGLDRAEVDEHVLAALVRGDEAIPLRIVEPFNGSGCHIEHLPPRSSERTGGAKTRDRYSL